MQNLMGEPEWSREGWRLLKREALSQILSYSKNTATSGFF
jgi:hypothetical protein